MDSSSIVAKAGGEVEVLLIGEIGWDADPKSFAQELSGLGKVSKVHLRINSPGGSVFDAVSMRASLLALGAEINVTIEGLCASCATFFLTIADSVKVTSDSAVMIHEASVWGGGEAGDLRKMADRLDGVNGEMVKAYAIRMDKSEADVRKLMADETWFSAAEAVESGLADEVLEVEHKPAKKFVTQAIAAFASKFKNAPPWVTAQLSEPQKQPRASAPERKTSMSDIVLQALGLHAGDEVKAVAKIEALKTEGGEAAAELGKIHALVGSSGDAALGTITALQKRATDGDAAVQALAGLQAAAKVAQVKALVDQGFESGQITLALKPSMLEQSAEFLENYLANAPKIVPMGKGIEQPESKLSTPEKDWAYYADGHHAELKALAASDPEAYARVLETKESSPSA